MNGSGGEIADPAQFCGNPYMFTGRRLDPETRTGSRTGLYYYRTRMYDPELGRFMQTDPIGYYDSMNLYQYSGNNPINWIDPTGKSLLGKLIREIFFSFFSNPLDPRDMYTSGVIGADVPCPRCLSQCSGRDIYCPSCGMAIHEYIAEGWYRIPIDQGGWRGRPADGYYYYRPPYPPQKGCDLDGQYSMPIMPTTGTDPVSLPDDYGHPFNFKQWPGKDADYNGNRGTWYNYNPYTYESYGNYVPIRGPAGPYR